MTVQADINMNHLFTEDRDTGAAGGNPTQIISSIKDTRRPTYFRSWSQKITVASGTQTFTMSALTAPGLADTDLATDQFLKWISLNYTGAAGSGTVVFKQATTELVTYQLSPGCQVVHQTPFNTEVLGQPVSTFEVTAAVGPVEVEVILLTTSTA